jgi:predicted nuclease of predicted toxin-antitoxin system
VGLDSAPDAAVWAYAKEQAFAIVSKDADFRHLGFTYGPPPKIVWIDRGNFTTREIGTLFRQPK